MASHQFRTPLSTILSSAALISKYPLDHQQTKRDKHIQRIKISVRHLDMILEDFLSLSKLEEGVIRNSPVLFDFNHFLEHEIKEKLRKILKAGQQIETNYEGSTEIVLDKKMLKTILFCLISNAEKYSASNKTIKINAKQTGQQLDIDVIDEGIGIPAAEIDHIFERFYRAKNAQYHRGIGIGLNIVQQYIELMDGAISVNSKQGQGTSIKLIFSIPEY